MIGEPDYDKYIEADNPSLDYEYCERHDVAHDGVCEECKGEYEDSLYDSYMDK